MINMWHLNQQIFILPKEKGGLNDESGNLFPVEGHQTPLQTIYFLLRVAASCKDKRTTNDLQSIHIKLKLE
jgi:hypothetical protein